MRFFRKNPKQKAAEVRHLLAEMAAKKEKRELSKVHREVAPLLQAQDHEALEAKGWHRVAPIKWVIE